MTSRRIPSPPALALGLVMGSLALLPWAAKGQAVVAAKVVPSGKGIAFVLEDGSKTPPSQYPSLVSAYTTPPTIRVNGGPPIPLGSPTTPAYWGEGLHNNDGSTRSKSPYLPWVYFPFVQSAPAAKYEAIGSHLNVTSGNWTLTQFGNPPVGAGRFGFNKLARVSQGTASSATWPQVPLPAGTYTVSATWVADPGFSKGVTCTLTPAYATTDVLAPVPGSGAVATFPSTATFPHAPRFVSATVSGPAATIQAGSVVVSGTDASGAAISETLPPFTAGVTGTVTGVKSFSTVTSATIPAQPPAVPGHTPITTSVGSTLAIVPIDQTLAPSGAVDQGVPWQSLGTYTLDGYADGLVVTQANPAGGWMVADAVKFERTSTDLSLSILPTDVVTYSAPAGWATSQAGGAPAATDVLAENHSGGALYPPLPASPTMGLGWNINTPSYYQGMQQYGNYAKVVGPIPALAYDAYGNPTKLASSSSATTLVISCPYTAQGDGKKYAVGPAGTWTVSWDGASSVSLRYGAEDLTKKAVTGGVGNRRSFAFPADDSRYGPDVYVQVLGTTRNADGTYNCDVRNLVITPPGIDPANVPLFTPQITAALANSRGLRFLDPIGGNSGNAATFADYNRPLTDVSRVGPTRVITANVVRVEGYSGRLLDPTQGANVLYTTSSPHGLASGQVLHLTQGVGVATFSDGNSRSLDGNLGNAESLVHVLSPTTFVCQPGSQAYRPRTAVTMTNVLTPAAGSVTAYAGNGMPISDMIALCNEARADLYLNLCISGAGADAAIGDYVGRHLAPGLKFRVEVANETWNYSLGSNGYWYQARTYALGLGPGTNYVPAYCEDANARWPVVKAAYVAAGGNPTSFVRVLASQHGSPGVTANLAAYCQGRGIGFDELATGPYWANNATPVRYGRTLGEPWAAPIVDVLTAEQVLDVYELFWVWGGHELEYQGHRAALTAHGFAGVKLIAYEGGPDFMLPVPSGNARVGERTHAATRHPRFHGIYQHNLRVMQDSGCTLFHDYILAGGDGGQGFVAWPAYLGTGMPAGTGSPTTDALNIANPDDLDTAKSEHGGGALAWSARQAGAIVIPPAMQRLISLLDALRKLRGR